MELRRHMSGKVTSRPRRAGKVTSRPRRAGAAHAQPSRANPALTAQQTPRPLKVRRAPSTTAPFANLAADHQEPLVPEGRIPGAQGGGVAGWTPLSGVSLRPSGRTPPGSRKNCQTSSDHLLSLVPRRLSNPPGGIPRRPKTRAPAPPAPPPGHRQKALSSGRRPRGAAGCGCRSGEGVREGAAGALPPASGRQPPVIRGRPGGQRIRQGRGSCPRAQPPPPRTSDERPHGPDAVRWPPRRAIPGQQAARYRPQAAQAQPQAQAGAPHRQPAQQSPPRTP